MQSRVESGQDWTVVLRRQPARLVAGQAEGGYTDAFEIICCDCGDHPDLDYGEVSPELQRIRGPYRLPAGIAAYEKHVASHHRRRRAGRGARRASA
jgi:hypothetical protein